jgi:hypothetical protein
MMLDDLCNVKRMPPARYHNAALDAVSMPSRNKEYKSIKLNHPCLPMCEC